MNNQNERDLCDKVASLMSQLEEAERSLAALKIKYTEVVEKSRLLNASTPMK
jgi:hypothetical protein